MLRKILLTLFVLVALTSGCVVATPAPSSTPQKITTVENAGEICFSAYNVSTKKLTGVFYPKGCYSSSCTRPLEQTVKAELDRNQHIIKLITRFVLLDTTVRFPEAQQCTADCGGGGEISFEIEDVADGVYAIQLGDKSLESLTLPVTFTQAAGICFGDR